MVTELPAAFEDVVLQLEQADILSKDLIRKLSEVNFQSEIRQIIEAVFSGIGNILNLFSSVVSSVISGVTSTFLAFAFAVYLLIGKDKLAGQADRLMKRWMKDGLYKKVRYVMAVVNDSFHRFVVGQCTEAVILGTLCTIGMLILRLPYAVMIGAVIAFTALIPMVGAFLGGAVGAFLIFMVSPVKALIFLIFLIVLQQVEGNLIYPRVVGSSIGLPGIWVLAAVTIGGGVFGIFGMLIGVPIAAALYRLIKNDLHQYEKTNIVVNTSIEETTQGGRIFLEGRIGILELFHQFHETSILFVGQRVAVISCKGCTLEQFLRFCLCEDFVFDDESGADCIIFFGGEVVGRVVAVGKVFAAVRLSPATEHEAVFFAVHSGEHYVAVLG